MQPRVNGRFGTMPMKERFWAKVKKTDTCWLWTASVNERGYGNFWDKGQIRKAYTVAWEMFNGAVPKGLELDHLCEVQGCVNPSHLEAVPHQVNTQRYYTNRKLEATPTKLKEGKDE